MLVFLLFFFFNDTATTEIYTLSLHERSSDLWHLYYGDETGRPGTALTFFAWDGLPPGRNGKDRKSTRLNSSHGSISYAVFCLKKKKQITMTSIIKEPMEKSKTILDSTALKQH